MSDFTFLFGSFDGELADTIKNLPPSGFHEPLLLGLSVVLLWDGYFFLNYIISLFRNYPIREWTPAVSVIIPPAYNEGGSGLLRP